MRPSGRRRRTIGHVLTQLGELAQFGLGNRALQLLELFVQQPDFLAVSQSEGGEVRLCPGDFVGAVAEHAFEFGHSRAQAVGAVVVRTIGSDEGHSEIISNGLRRSRGTMRYAG